MPRHGARTFGDTIGRLDHLEELLMTWDQIKGKWRQLKDRVRVDISAVTETALVALAVASLAFIPAAPAQQLQKNPATPAARPAPAPRAASPVARPAPAPGAVARPAPAPRAVPNAIRQARFPTVSVNNRFFPIVRAEKFIHMGGRNRFFVPLGALGAVLIGESYWNPDGYVSTAAPLCTGFTPDGCQLYWRMVDFVDGGGEPQCVQYCPLSGPPPTQIATLPPPPPLPPEGTCQIAIFSDPNFAGTSAPTGDNQPNLSESGWQNAISSVQVQSGTWDFFTDDDYGGSTMRLTAGTYPTLTPDWDKKINSFMCVAPGPGA